MTDFPISFIPPKTCEYYKIRNISSHCRYAQYSHFKIYSEADYYKLEIDGYEGNAGDSLNDPWYGSNNSPFSTYNRDNDRSSLNCASMLKVVIHRLQLHNLGHLFGQNKRILKYEILFDRAAGGGSRADVV